MTPAAFDANAYLDAYPDVAQAAIDPFVQYLRDGKNEGRKGFTTEVFDSEAYLSANPDFRGKISDAYQHFIHFGRAEGRPVGVPRKK